MARTIYHYKVLLEEIKLPNKFSTIAVTTEATKRLADIFHHEKGKRAAKINRFTTVAKKEIYYNILYVYFFIMPCRTITDSLSSMSPRFKCLLCKTLPILPVFLFSILGMGGGALRIGKISKLWKLGIFETYKMYFRHKINQFMFYSKQKIKWISRCWLQHVSVESSSLLHHSIYLCFICFT